jgi:hypothetical protein
MDVKNDSVSGAGREIYHVKASSKGHKRALNVSLLNARYYKIIDAPKRAIVCNPGSCICYTRVVKTFKTYYKYFE